MAPPPDRVNFMLPPNLRPNLKQEARSSSSISEPSIALNFLKTCPVSPGALQRELERDPWKLQPGGQEVEEGRVPVLADLGRVRKSEQRKEEEVPAKEEEERLSPK